MSLKVKETTPDQALQDYLDTIYIQSHSQASVDSYRTAIIGSKNGFRIFLKEKYNCDEIQLAHFIGYIFLSDMILGKSGCIRTIIFFKKAC